eukprot:615568-Hanusia_phi.AAC.1
MQPPPQQQMQPPPQQQMQSAPAVQQAYALTQEDEYVLRSSANMQTRFCQSMPKKMAEDVGKRMNNLDERIRAGQVSRDVVGQLVNYCQALERNDVNTASSIQTALTASHWDEHRQWLVSFPIPLVVAGSDPCAASVEVDPGSCEEVFAVT